MIKKRRYYFKKICPICKKEFRGSEGKTYCSIECRRVARPRTVKTCSICQKKFFVDYLKQQYCSVKCKIKGLKGKSSRKKGRHFPHLYRARVINCEFCGKEFRAVKDFKERRQKYCSVACYMKARPESPLESRVSTCLNSLSIKYIREHKIDRFFADFFLPEFNAVIEVDSDRWHKAQIKKEHDRIKDMVLANKGFTICRIPEKQIKYAREIILSFIQPGSYLPNERIS